MPLPPELLARLLPGALGVRPGDVGSPLDAPVAPIGAAAGAGKALLPWVRRLLATKDPVGKAGLAGSTFGLGTSLGLLGQELSKKDPPPPATPPPVGPPVGIKGKYAPGPARSLGLGQLPEEYGGTQPPRSVSLRDLPPEYGRTPPGPARSFGLGQLPDEYGGTQPPRSFAMKDLPPEYGAYNPPPATSPPPPGLQAFSMKPQRPRSFTEEQMGTAEPPPIQMEPFSVSLPGKAPQTARGGVPPTRPAAPEYMVKGGDTLYDIAAALIGPGASHSDKMAMVDKIAELSGIADPDVIEPGQMLQTGGRMVSPRGVKQAAARRRARKPAPRRPYSGPMGRSPRFTEQVP